MAISTNRENQLSLRASWLEVGLIFVVFFVAGGAPAPHVNEAHYLTKAKQYWQPEWCQGDLFLESGKAHVTFYWTVGVLTKWFELPTVAWIGRIVAWLALAIGWQRLNRVVISLPFRAVLTAMLLVTLIDWTNFAGEWVIGGVEGKCFAYALVFFGLAEMAAGRWRRVWPCLGLASAFHVLVGGWSTVAAGVVWLSADRDRRTSLSAMLPSLLLGAVLAAPGVVPALQLTQAVSPETVDRANQIYVFDRLPHHLAPLAMKSQELGKKAFRFSALLLGFAWLYFFASRKPTSADGDSFQPLELVMRFAVVSLVISVLGLAWQLATWNHPALAAKLLKYYWFRLADVAVPIATALSLVWLINEQLTRHAKLGAILLAAVVLLPSLHLLDQSRQRLNNPVAPSDRKLRDSVAFREACDWIQQHTKIDALFLVPRHSQSFKWYAGRADLVTWKDVPQNATDLVIWQKRLFDVHRYTNADGEQTNYRSLAHQGTARIRQLAAKYQLDYVLTREYPPLSLPVAYANTSYTIYDTSSASE